MKFSIVFLNIQSITFAHIRVIASDRISSREISHFRETVKFKKSDGILNDVKTLNLKLIERFRRKIEEDRGLMSRVGRFFMNAGRRPNPR